MQRKTEMLKKLITVVVAVCVVTILMLNTSRGRHSPTSAVIQVLPDRAEKESSNAQGPKLLRILPVNTAAPVQQPQPSLPGSQNGPKWRNQSTAATKTSTSENSSKSKRRQIIILSTWRSGSTFLEALFQSHPGMFDIYEPLIPFGMIRFNETSPQALLVQQILHDLLRCRYTINYIKMMMESPTDFVSRNVNYFCLTLKNAHRCITEEQLSGACTSSPLMVMKLVRLGLGLLRPILEDQSLQPQVVFLVRDPRAVMHSRRKTVKWCNDPSCNDIASLCQQMEDDLNSFNTFLTLFPRKLHILRYEDLSLSPFNVTQQLLNSMDLDYDPKMKTFLLDHTTRAVNSPSTTFRKSSEHVLSWTKSIDKETLNRVQTMCSAVMKKFGYIHINKSEGVNITDVLETPAPL